MGIWEATHQALYALARGELDETAMRLDKLRHQIGDKPSERLDPIHPEAIAWFRESLGRSVTDGTVVVQRAEIAEKLCTLLYAIGKQDGRESM